MILSQKDTSIREKDIDLILLEEFNSNDDFSKWFVEILKLPNFIKKNSTHRSVTAGDSGETDILFSYFSTEGIIYVLIENKIDAPFTFNQFGKYEERSKKYISDNECKNCYIILLAPKKFILGQSFFENCIAYEDIKLFFQSLDGERFIFKSELFSIAINKSRRSYDGIFCPIVTEFWALYFEFLQNEFPQFIMVKPEKRRSGSDWPNMKFPDLEKIKFVHKLQDGFIDAEFPPFLIENDKKLKNLLISTKFKIYYPKDSDRFAIRIISESVYRKKNFFDQIEKIKIGLNKMEELKNFIIINSIRHNGINS